ncbi:MAG TPA: hypothetical protein VHK01_20470 [Lacipirellulaceae bacterium]|jgi:hypothetical protein|nr:hypothetical protein [Lacipirellulaceae bacterium]
MKASLHWRVAIGLLVLTTSGCRIFINDDDPLGKSPLRPAAASPDSVAMEIIWARFPSDDSELNEAAWREIDETQIAPSVRRELTNNGFRVGVIGGAVPAAIARALGSGESQDDEPSTHNRAEAATLTAEPIVHGRIQQLRRNQRSEIQASEVYSSLPLLVNCGQELTGRTYSDAQAIYALRVDSQPDQTVMVELTPELHYGPAQLRFTRDDDDLGILRQAPLREREVFSDLRMSVRLAPGEMLVLMGLRDAGSRLGDCFHSVESSEGRQQKLILIRLAEVPPSEMFEFN